MAYSGMFSNIGLEQLRRALHSSVERDWQDAHTPRNLVMALVHEVGELAGVFRWKGDGAAACLSSNEKRRVTHELSELLLCLIRLSDACGVDLGRAALDKLAANAAKFPKGGPPPPGGSAASAAAEEQQHPGIGQLQPPPPPPPPPGQAGGRPRVSLSAGLEDIIHGSPLSSPLQQQQQQLELQQTHASSRPRSSSSGSSSLGTPAPTAAAFIAGLPAATRQHASHAAGRPPSGQSSPGTAALLVAMQAHSSPPSLSLAGQQQQPPPPPPPQQPPPPERLAFSGMPSSSAVEEELMHVGKAAGLLPQGLLAEIEHGLDGSGGGHAARGSCSTADSGALAPAAPAPITPLNGSSGTMSAGATAAAPAGSGGLWLSSGLQGCLSSNSTAGAGGGQLEVMPCGSVGSTTAPSAAGSSVWLFPTSSHDHSTASAPSTVGEESELDSECSHPGGSGRAGATTLAAIVAARAKCACCGRDAHGGDCLAALCGSAGAALAPGKCAVVAAPGGRSLSASTASDAPAAALQPSRDDYGVQPTFSV